jgi:hypothetical protein
VESGAIRAHEHFVFIPGQRKSLICPGHFKLSGSLDFSPGKTRSGLEAGLLLAARRGKLKINLATGCGKNSKLVSRNCHAPVHPEDCQGLGTISRMIPALLVACSGLYNALNHHLRRSLC